jgi:hypothetical protein
MYEFQYFKCKSVRIKFNIGVLAEVEFASYFLCPLIANPLISPKNLAANPLIFS